MPETFECPQCGKQYPRERRLAGKAVACECGHRFLAPMLEPPAAPLKGLPIPPGSSPANPPYQTPRPAPPAAGARGPAGAMPARALPATPAKPARWANPAPPSQPPPAAPAQLTEADLFEEPPQRPAASPFGAPLSESAQGPVYAVPAGMSPLPPNPYKPPPPKPKKKAKKQSTRQLSATIGAWVAGISLIVFLPAAGFCSVMAMVRYSQQGWGGVPDGLRRAALPPSQSSPPHNRPSPPRIQPSPQPAPSVPSGEPSPAGQLVTIWNAKQTSQAGQVAFSLEYRLDGLPVSPDAKYFWIVVDRTQAKVEFPVPASVLKPRDHLSGQPKGLAPGQLKAPLRTYLERQSPGMAQRETISNTVQFAGG